LKFPVESNHKRYHKKGINTQASNENVLGSK
jgi:hypothetical protein